MRFSIQKLSKNEFDAFLVDPARWEESQRHFSNKIYSSISGVASFEVFRIVNRAFFLT